MTALQLDLFGQVLSREQQRRHDALVCLRDAVSDALEVVAELRYPPGMRDVRSPKKSGPWAWCVSRAGLRVEDVPTWWAGTPGTASGWDRTPAHLTTWAELTGLLGADPRRAEIAAWIASLPQPRWRLTMRPHELWPEPGGWHTSYLCRDHVDAQWPARRRCWQLLHDLLTDAVTAVAAGEP